MLQKQTPLAFFVKNYCTRVVQDTVCEIPQLFVLSAFREPLQDRGRRKRDFDRLEHVFDSAVAHLGNE